MIQRSFASAGVLDSVLVLVLVLVLVSVKWRGAGGRLLAQQKGHEAASNGTRAVRLASMYVEGEEVDLAADHACLKPSVSIHLDHIRPRFSTRIDGCGLASVAGFAERAGRLPCCLCGAVAGAVVAAPSAPAQARCVGFCL